MDNGHVGVCISFSPYSPAHCVNMKAYLRAVLFRGLEKEDKHISQDLLDVWFGLFWLDSMEFVWAFYLLYLSKRSKLLERMAT